MDKVCKDIVTGEKRQNDKKTKGLECRKGGIIYTMTEGESTE